MGIIQPPFKALAVLWMVICPTSLLAALTQPNIVLIISDDQGWGDFGCMGHPHIQTPHLDRLAAEGMRFTQFYNNAVCNVTRAAMLTGVNARHGKGGLLRSNMVTMAEVLRQAGYATTMSGKWKAPA